MVRTIVTVVRQSSLNSTDFMTMPGDGRILIVFKRQSP